MVKATGFNPTRTTNKSTRTHNLTVNHNKLKRRAAQLKNETEKRVDPKPTNIQGGNALTKALAFAKQQQQQQKKAPRIYGKPPTTVTSTSSTSNPPAASKVSSSASSESTSSSTSSSTSTSTHKPNKDSPSYVLSSHQGFINVAFEEWILQHATGLEQHELWAIFQQEWAGIEEKYHYELPPHTHRPFNLFNYTKMLTKHQHKAKFRQDVKEARVMLDAIAHHYQPMCDAAKKRRLEEEESEKRRKEREERGEEADSESEESKQEDIDPITNSPHATVILASPHLRAMWDACWLPAVLKRPHETLLQFVKRGGAPPSLELINAITATVAAQKEYDAQHPSTSTSTSSSSSSAQGRKRKR